MKKVGVLLSGCGFLDGAEVTEAVLTLTILETLGSIPVPLSLDENAFHEVNHTTQTPTGLKRNILDESNRIVRGKCQELGSVPPQELDALVIPGGFGVAKNFCDFATKGSTATVHEKIENYIKTIHNEGKPIGAICIALALIALILGDKKPLLTIGNDQETASELEKCGARHLATKADEIAVDEKLKIVSTGAYMFDNASRADVFQGIQGCLKKVLELSLK